MTQARAIFVAAASLLVAGVAGAPLPASGAAGDGFDPAGHPPRAVVLVDAPVPAPGPDSPRPDRAALARSGQLLSRVASAHDLGELDRVPELGMLVVELGDGSLAGLREELAGDPRVKAVRIDRPVELRFRPNDFAFNSRDPNAPGGTWMQWNLRRHQALRAWDLSRGRGAEVAVVDTGVSGGHPDLKPRIVGGASFGTTAPMVDENGHGTHTSGLACGQSNNGFGIASLGYRCNLFIAKYGQWCSEVAAGITAAANRGSDAINLSLGGCDTTLNAALRYAWLRGSIPVAAAANVPSPSPSINYPAQYVQPEGTGPNLAAGRGLVVTAAKHNGRRARWAQRTTGVSVAAFGAATDAKSGGQQGILSAWPPSLPPITGDIELMPPVRTTVDGDPRFAYLVGTSMAAPQVSGLVALIRAVRPRMSARRVVRLIKLTASGRGRYVRGLGWGIISARSALGAALGRDVTPPVSRVRSARVRRAAGVPRGRRLIVLRLKRFDPRRPAMPTSGVRSVSVFVSGDGSRFKRFRKTRRTTVRFLGRPGRRYRFYTRAVDRAGNREANRRGADVTLRPR